MEEHYADRGTETLSGDISEVELVTLLTSLCVEPTPEADFEGRFLYDFHEHIASEAVCRPARKLVVEHVAQLLANIGGRRIAYGASTLSLGALAVGFFVWPSSSVSPSVVAAPSSIERSVASLKPGRAREFTCIPVSGGKCRSFTQDGLAMQGAAVLFDYQEDSDTVEGGRKMEPVNMGLSDEEVSVFVDLVTPFPL